MQEQLTEQAQLSQYGVAGIVLAIFFPFVIALVWYTIRTSNKVLREKDEDLKEINERRTESATDAVAAITEMNEHLKRILKVLEIQNGGSRDREDDPTEDADTLRN